MISKLFKDTFQHGFEALKDWNPKRRQAGNGDAEVLDFFCGAGGMSLGFAALSESFKLIGGVDINKTSLQTYAQNYHVPTLNADISKLTGNESVIRSTFGISPDHQRPLIFIGCAPCQGFSSHRKKDHNKPEDARNFLIGKFAEIAMKFNPDFVVMENVPEILTGKYRSHYDEAKRIFESANYHVNQKIYNAAGFGVPQARNRAIIVASKNKSFELPDELLETDNYKTVRDAIGDLPPVASGDICPTDPYHHCSRHRNTTIDIIAQVPHNGGSRPKGIGPQCLDKVKGFYDVYGRLSWDKPSVTITRYARNPASGRFSHPEQDRGLTIREAARLQSFPDGFLWHGSLGEDFQQIGEAVPPLLSLAIATQIAIAIKNKD